MGKRVTVTLYDDMDPELEATEEREFSVNGTDYHLDLSKKNADQFDKDQEKWVAVATKVGRATTRSRASKRVTHSGGEPGLPIGEIRKWAEKNGHEVSDRGRVSAEVVRAWKAAGSPTGDQIDKPEEPKKAAPAKKAAAGGKTPAAAQKDHNEPSTEGLASLLP